MVTQSLQKKLIQAIASLPMEDSRKKALISQLNSSLTNAQVITLGMFLDLDNYLRCITGTQYTQSQITEHWKPLRKLLDDCAIELSKTKNGNEALELEKEKLRPYIEKLFNYYGQMSKLTPEKKYRSSAKR